MPSKHHTGLIQPKQYPKGKKDNTCYQFKTTLTGKLNQYTLRLDLLKSLDARRLISI